MIWVGNFQHQLQDIYNFINWNGKKTHDRYQKKSIWRNPINIASQLSIVSSDALQVLKQYRIKLWQVNCVNKVFSMIKDKVKAFRKRSYTFNQKAKEQPIEIWNNTWQIHNFMAMILISVEEISLSPFGR